MTTEKRQVPGLEPDAVYLDGADRPFHIEGA